VALVCPSCKQTLTPGDFYRNATRPKGLVFVHELITQIGVAYYDQDWGSRWRKGRLLPIGAIAVFGCLLGAWSYGPSDDRVRRAPAEPHGRAARAPGDRQEREGDRRRVERSPLPARAEHAPRVATHPATPTPLQAERGADRKEHTR
jgi:hypothetical protein